MCQSRGVRDGVGSIFEDSEASSCVFYKSTHVAEVDDARRLLDPIEEVAVVVNRLVVVISLFGKRRRVADRHPIMLDDGALVAAFCSKGGGRKLSKESFSSYLIGVAQEFRA